MTLDKIVLIKKATQLEEMLRRFTTPSRVKFVLESRGESFDYYKEAHDTYKIGLEQALATLPIDIRKQTVDKNHLSTFQFGDTDLIVVVGDDGLVVNVAKYVGKQPIISVNPDEKRFDGVLASCTIPNFPGLLKATLGLTYSTESLTMAETRLEDGQMMYALNDLFIGRRTHVSAKYTVEYMGKQEKQSSSGLIVSTGTGSTGWMRSILTGANMIANGTRVSSHIPFPQDADYLLFAAREPFPSKMSNTDIVFGKVSARYPLKITSNMPEGGVIFSDGIEEDYLDFNAGSIATIQPSEKKVYLVHP